MHLDKKYQIEPTRMIDKHLDVMTMVETLARPLKVIPLNDVVWRFNDSDLVHPDYFGNFLEMTWGIEDIAASAPNEKPSRILVSARKISLRLSPMVVVWWIALFLSARLCR